MLIYRWVYFINLEEALPDWEIIFKKEILALVTINSSSNRMERI